MHPEATVRSSFPFTSRIPNSPWLAGGPLLSAIFLTSGCTDYSFQDYKGGYGEPDDTPFVETVG
jgi:hypothetical protein